MSNEIPLFKGDDKTISVVVTDENDTPISIYGASFLFTVKDIIEESDAYAAIQKSSADDTQIKVTDALAGELEIYIVPTDTKDLVAKNYMYDIEMTDSLGKVETLVVEKFVLKEDVTKG